MKEAGHRLRFLMRCLEEVAATKFDGKKWSLDAVSMQGTWAGAIILGEGKKFYMCINTDMYDINKVMDAAQRLWPSWGGYMNKSTSSSASLTTSLTSGEARIFCLQDHA
eukprot:8585132-Alexandrium_andersonii.AAC.1